MKQAVTRTRENLSERIEDVVSLSKEIDRNTLDELEATLIGADLGTTTTQEVLAKAARKSRPQADQERRRTKAAAERRAAGHPGMLPTSSRCRRWTERPEVILVVGVNGTGKTTTIGKLAQVLRAQGKTVLLCAADTFRAAAIEQLEIWGTAHRHRSHPHQGGRRPRRRSLRRPASRQRAQHRLRHR